MLRTVALTRELAAEKADELASLETGIPDDYWEAKNFVSEFPGKWDLSTLLVDGSDQIAGYSIASRPEPSRAHLHRIVIAERYRGKGFGSSLIESLRTRARESGLRRLSLKVGEDNSAAKRLYTRLGFDLDDDSGPYQWMSESLVDNLIVACHQPNFLPWAGYFAKLMHCDCFVILDDAQMPGGGSYVSRTRVADPGGSRWLTVPITRSFGQKIFEVKLALQQDWQTRHLTSIRQLFAKAPHLDDVLSLLQQPYEAKHVQLSAFNLHLLERVLAFLGIRRKMYLSSEMNIDSTGDQRLIDLVQQVGGDCYLSGRGGKNYQDPAKFAAAGIDLNVMDYQPIAYTRGKQDFVPGLSILDLIAWCGRDVFDYLRYTQP